RRRTNRWPPSLFFLPVFSGFAGPPGHARPPPPPATLTARWRRRGDNPRRRTRRRGRGHRSAASRRAKTAESAVRVRSGIYRTMVGSAANRTAVITGHCARRKGRDDPASASPSTVATAAVAWLEPAAVPA